MILSDKHGIFEETEHWQTKFQAFEVLALQNF